MSCLNFRDADKPKDDTVDSKGEPDKKKNGSGKSTKTPEESTSKEESAEVDEEEEELVEVEDDDDYLLYLEVILRTIHTAYYDLYDQMREERDPLPSTSSSSPSPSVPDLKTVIPYVKRKVGLSMSYTRGGTIPSCNSCPRYCKARTWCSAALFPLISR